MKTWLHERKELKQRKNQRRKQLVTMGWYLCWDEKTNGGWKLKKKSLRTKDYVEACRKAYGNGEESQLVRDSKPAQMTLQEFRDLWINELLPSDGKPESTINKYRVSTDHLINFMEERFPGVTYVNQVAPYHIDDFKSYRIKCKEVTSVETVRGDLRSLKQFFKRAIIREQTLGKDNPVNGIKVQGKKNKIKDIFNPDEISLMDERSKKIKQLHVVIKFFLQTGVRKESVINARWENINWEKKTIRLDWKGGRTEVITLPETTFRLISRLPRVNEYIFPNPHKSHKKRWIKMDRDIREFLNSLKIKGSPHKFRHTFTSYSLHFNMPLTVLLDKLKHHDPKITKDYMHLVKWAIPSKVEKIFTEWRKG